MPIATLDQIRAKIGTDIGTSEWITVDQLRIQAFADATEDQQFIHVDPAAAALSLLSRMAADVMMSPDSLKMAVNYGLDRIRFIAPVRSGKRIRGQFTLDSLDEKAPGQLLMRHTVTVEIEGEAKPALTAQWLGLLFV
jgi:acyl dehydratase